MVSSELARDRIARANASRIQGALRRAYAWAVYRRRWWELEDSERPGPAELVLWANGLTDSQLLHLHSIGVRSVAVIRSGVIEECPTCHGRGWLPHGV